MKTLIVNNKNFYFNEENNQWIISKGITKIKIKENFNNSIDTLPDTIKIIYIHKKNLEHKIKKWPSNLKKLVISYYDNQPYLNKGFEESFDEFPSNLEHLNLYVYNDKFPTLPSSLKKLEIVYSKSDKNFDSLINLDTLKISEIKNKINNFPPKLKHFYSHDYDFPIDNLPITLTHLECAFMNSNMVLPPNLTMLKCEIDCVFPFVEFPPKITYLELSWTSHFDTKLHSVGLPKFPDSVLTIILRDARGFQIELPTNLKNLTLENSNIDIKIFPSNLKKLSINSSSSSNFLTKNSIVLPDKLKYLEITNDHVDIVNFPSTLEMMSLGYNEKILFPDFVFPPRLTHLSVCCADFLTYNKTLPNTITKLKISIPQDSQFYNAIVGFNRESFQQTNKILMSMIPLSVKTLEVFHYDLYDYSTLPPNVSNLIINAYFDRIIGSITGTVKNLIINAQQKNIYVEKLNYGIENFKLNTSTSNEEIFDNLPETIKGLDLYLQKSKTNLTNLPNGLEHMILDLGKRSNYNYILEKLPESLKILHFRIKGWDIDLAKEIDYSNLPNSLHTINFL